MQAVAAGGGAGCGQHAGLQRHHNINHVASSVAAVNTAGEEVGPHHYHSYTDTQEEEMPDSPSYSQPGYHDSFQYGETSASASNSGEEEDERDYEGKRSGDPLTGLAAKKRRKQSLWLQWFQRSPHRRRSQKKLLQTIHLGVLRGREGFPDGRGSPRP